MSTEEDRGVRYPYLVLALMPGVYPKREIRFGPRRRPRLLGPLYVEADEPASGPLRGPARRAVLDACIAEAQRTELRMCLVLSSSRCVYIEPDGRVSIHGREPTTDLHATLAEIDSDT